MFLEILRQRDSRLDAGVVRKLWRHELFNPCLERRNRAFLEWLIAEHLIIETCLVTGTSEFYARGKQNEGRIKRKKSQRVRQVLASDKMWFVVKKKSGST